MFINSAVFADDGFAASVALSLHMGGHGNRNDLYGCIGIAHVRRDGVVVGVDYGLRGVIRLRSGNSGRGPLERLEV